MYQVKKRANAKEKELTYADIQILSKLGEEEVENINKLQPQIVVIST